jgi:hypothetical protein
MANWTANSSDALHLSLGILLCKSGLFTSSPGFCIVRANKDKEVLGDNESYETFHPTFTYPVHKLFSFEFASSSLIFRFRYMVKMRKYMGTRTL